MLQTLAPAKINLYLHVTGKRADGYHLLDSLVAFTDIADAVRLEPSEKFAFTLEGPLAESLRNEPPETNLAVRAAQKASEFFNTPLNVHITLIKNLPTASGIGGGSSDAAAVLRLLATHWNLDPQNPQLSTLAASLGQDIPCCLPAETCYFQGIGDVVTQGPMLPPTAIVLVNPNKALPTPAVFKARTGEFLPPARLDATPRTAQDLAVLLQQRDNNLTETACALMPEIRTILAALTTTPECLLARMSGSGATCFGLYPDIKTAEQAAAHLRAAHPTWWIAQGIIPFNPATTR